MNRRRFFGNLGIIIAASLAPSIIVPKTHINWGRPTLYVPKVHRLKAIWSYECAQDLAAYHGINAEKEMAALLEYYVQQEIPDREVLSTEFVKSYDPMTWVPRGHWLVTVNEPVV